jgi:hypothetical protein
VNAVAQLPPAAIPEFGNRRSRNVLTTVIPRHRTAAYAEHLAVPQRQRAPVRPAQRALTLTDRRETDQAHASGM